MGLWDCPGELKKEGRNDAVEVPEREVESSGIVGGECSVVCPRGPAGSRFSCSEAFSIKKDTSEQLLLTGAAGIGDLSC